MPATGKQPCLTVMLALTLNAGVTTCVWAQNVTLVDQSHNQVRVASIGESLNNAGKRPLHILYVHGIGATGAGDSRIFRTAVCAYVKNCDPPAAVADLKTDYADAGEFASGADAPVLEYMNKRVWTSKEEWRASAPFVDHYVLRRGDVPIVVDEINWWPLVFPLKCRFMMTGEAHLAGPNAAFLNLCSQPPQTDPSQPDRFRAYTWIGPQDAKALESLRPKGALVNRDLKNSILDWGFSDAIISIGSMRALFRESMRQLFVKCARFNANGSKTGDWEQQRSINPRGIDREFAVVSHSLGSYLVFSTLGIGQPDGAPPETATTEDAAAQYILERTSLVYFFANQIPLLELANVEGAAAGASSGTVIKRMLQWKDLRQAFKQGRSETEASTVKPPQIIAWSDPSDLLTWRLPGMEGLVIANPYVRNTRWHYLFANPAAAHDNYASNKKVLRVILGPKASGARRH